MPPRQFSGGSSATSLFAFLITVIARLAIRLFIVIEEIVIRVINLPDLWFRRRGFLLVKLTAQFRVLIREARNNFLQGQNAVIERGYLILDVNGLGTLRQSFKAAEFMISVRI